MELQGKKAVTHDFLSLHKDSSLPDSRPSPQGFLRKTHDFLPPLERREGSGGRGAGPAPAGIDLNVAAAPPAERPAPAEHALPSCFGAYGDVGLVRGCAGTVPLVVKPEWSTCAPPSPGASGPETKADTEGSGVAAGAGAATCNSARNGAGRQNACNPADVYWREPAYTTTGPQQQHLQRQQWPSPSPLPAARGGSGSSFPPFSSSGCGAAASSASTQQPARDRRPLMDAASRSNKGFADDDEEDEEDFGRNETTSHRGLMVKVDGGNTINSVNNSNDQKPSTPRSKHSATEQRRRSKINDRFQILRNLIPHSDQKRDKASFLLEVIDYIQFLQEKVQKYDSSFPEWGNDNVKLMPWKSSQAPGETMVDPSHIMKNGTLSSGFIFPADGTSANAPTVMLNAQTVAESENVSCGLASKSVSMPLPMQYPPGGVATGFFQPQQRLTPDSENLAAQPQGQWLRSCTTDYSVSADILSEHDDLVIDEGMISLSSMYSEGLLSNLTQALQSSGVDLSQATISVQINLGRRAISSRPISGAKDQDDPSSSNQVVGHSRVGSSGEELEPANKRHKSDAI